MTQAQAQNTPFLDELYQKYQKDASSVPVGWQEYFKNGTVSNLMPTKVPALSSSSHVGITSASGMQNNVSLLIQGFRSHGHKWAHINPLEEAPKLGEDLSLSAFGLDESALEQKFVSDGVVDGNEATLNEIITNLKKTYVGSVGVQYSMLTNQEERRWLRTKMESTQNTPDYSKEAKKRMLLGLIANDRFENFLHTKFVGMKRFSGEGGDAMIPMIDTMIDVAGSHNVDHILVGMAHRGRMSVLVNILNKPMEEIFSSYGDTIKIPENISGDVKYHQGKSYDIKTRSGHKVHMSLLNNPSHLEAVNPVVMGSAKAKEKEHGKGKVIPLLIHGDTAFAGQGIVAESLNLANLDGYSVGGTIHLVVNNQIGFTCNPQGAFSGEYCTDVAHMLQVPIFHVNGDDVEACNHVMELAMEWRQKFHKDVVIDLVCYRRYGHNEGDDPTFTQPQMYDKIKKHPRPYNIYAEKLKSEGSFKQEEIKDLEKSYTDKLQKAFEKSKKGVELNIDMFSEDSNWANMQAESKRQAKTTVPEAAIKNIAKHVMAWPKGFPVHAKVEKMLERRKNMLLGKEPMDWGTAEVAAYGSLLSEGHSVRISGQDVKRGTFSHRHVVQFGADGKEVLPIAKVAKKGATLEAWNSCLSEFAVLGFEYGYSLVLPDTLTVWEAQFGDFANGAQIMIDQFITSSEQKWQRMSGLVISLPHGHEGQGPEHSSARLERYLQLAGENNIVVANPTTPAQNFHLLRRQIHRKYRKPLFTMSPKSLLRHPLAVSTVDELTKGKFQKVIDDKEVGLAKTRRIVLCSGKIYYDLLEYRTKQKIKDVALVRIEQLYPLPVKAIKELLAKAPKAEICWAQEDSRNQGAWTFLLDNLQPELDKQMHYIGRPPMASPAVGSAKRHAKEQLEIVKTAFAK
jgi:2-oxoglutarate dehydrogenase E1 component